MRAAAARRSSASRRYSPSPGHPVDTTSRWPMRAPAPVGSMPRVPNFQATRAATASSAGPVGTTAAPE